MADGGLYTKPKRSPPSTTPQNKNNPSKFYTHFIFKAIIITLFLVIIPLFPSPDVNSPSIFSRWWELLHLIFVGIAVSYGLFSRKNDDLEGENNTINNSKFDNAQSYMSKLLQVPSVFDDDVDSPTGLNDNNINKVQTWSSQYYRNQPVLVVAKDGSFVDNKNNNINNSRVDEKPLLLPVRSLKSRVLDENDIGLQNKVDSRVYVKSNSSHSPREFSRRNDVKLVNGEETSRVSKGGYTRSNSNLSGKGLVSDSKRMSKNQSVKSRTSVNNKFGFVNGDGEVSRSLSKSNSSLSSRGFSSMSRKSINGDYGGLDDEEEEEHEKVEESVVLPSPIPWRSRSGRMEVNSLPSLPPSLEESGAAQLLRSLSSRSSSSSSTSPKELSPSPSMSSSKRLSPTPSISSESLAKSAEDFGRRKLVYSSHLPPPPPPPPPPLPMHRSVSSKSSSSKDKEEISSCHKVKRSVWSDPYGAGRETSREDLLNRVNSKPRNGIDCSSVGKSVRTVRAGETRKTREIEEEEERSEDIDSDVTETETENSERTSVGYNPISNPSFSEIPKETRDFLEQVLVETDDESGTEDDHYVEERLESAKAEEIPSDNVDEGPDVDKKADEFIAKFREQIRLQRIESIKRSTGQLKRSSIR